MDTELWSWVYILLFCGLVFWLSKNVVVACIIILAVATALECIRYPQPSKERVAAFLQFGRPLRRTTISGEYEHGLTNIAHRAAASDAPENTMAGLQYCVDNGVGAAEIDVSLTHDDILVLMHDDTIDRTTDGEGFVGDISMSQLTVFDAAAYHPLRDNFGAQKIPTLREAVQFARQNRLKLFLDVKATGSSQTVTKLAELFKEMPYLADISIVCSFSPWVIYTVRRSIPEAIVGLTHQHRVYQYTADGVRKNEGLLAHSLGFFQDLLLEWSQNAWLWYLIGNPIYIIHKSDISPNFVKFWAQRGIRVIAWTVNDHREKEYFKSLGVPFMTDTLET